MTEQQNLLGPRLLPLTLFVFQCLNQLLVTPRKHPHSAPVEGVCEGAGVGSGARVRLREGKLGSDPQRPNVTLGSRPSPRQEGLYGGECRTSNPTQTSA